MRTEVVQQTLYYETCPGCKKERPVKPNNCVALCWLCIEAQDRQRAADSIKHLVGGIIEAVAATLYDSEVAEMHVRLPDGQLVKLAGACDCDTDETKYIEEVL